MDPMADPDVSPDLDPDERSSLRELVKGIVVAQGNAFIKELLREKGIPIGVSKPEFERNLLAAIDRGTLVRGDIEDWLDEVEGWGDQHIYLYNVPRAIARDPVWRSAVSVRERVEAAGFGALWNASTSRAFPEEMTLTGIQFDESTLQLSWHRAADTWVREPARDRREEIEGDLYEFRAYRYRPARAVTRFVLRRGGSDPAAWVAAVFIPVAINSPEHEQILGRVDETLEGLLELFDFDQVRSHQVAIANVIRNLDHAHGAGSAGATPPVTTQTTRLTSGGSYVEFGTLSSSDDYRSSTAVRRVRRSIRSPQLPDFVGSSGKLQFLAGQASRLARDVKVQLFGEDKRIRIWRQLTASEVWGILDVLRSFQ
jgi:hypothetical protein